MNNIILLFLIFVLFSCQSKQQDGEKNEVIVEVPKAFEKSTMNNGNDNSEDTVGLSQFKRELATGVFDYKENHYIYFRELEHDYGILITDHKYDEIEETYYELFYKNEKKIFRTSDLRKLKEKLSELPRGITLDWYDTCTFSIYMSLSDEERKAFEYLCKSLSIVLIPPEWDGESKNMICYCSKLNNNGWNYNYNR